MAPIYVSRNHQWSYWNCPAQECRRATIPADDDALCNNCWWGVARTPSLIMGMNSDRMNSGGVTKTTAVRQQRRAFQKDRKGYIWCFYADVHPGRHRLGQRGLERQPIGPVMRWPRLAPDQPVSSQHWLAPADLQRRPGLDLLIGGIRSRSVGLSLMLIGTHVLIIGSCRQNRGCRQCRGGESNKFHVALHSRWALEKT